MAFRHEGAHRRGCRLGADHKLVTTAANVGDVTQAHALLHGQEQEAHADAGYQGVEKGSENATCAVAVVTDDDDHFAALDDGGTGVLATLLRDELAPCPVYRHSTMW